MNDSSRPDPAGLTSNDAMEQMWQLVEQLDEIVTALESLRAAMEDQPEQAKVMMDRLFGFLGSIQQLMEAMLKAQEEQAAKADERHGEIMKGLTAIYEAQRPAQAAHNEISPQVTKQAEAISRIEKMLAEIHAPLTRHLGPPSST
jgi:chromosome segregation ATPase